MKKLLLLCLSVLTASCDTATRQFESRLDEILSGHKAFVGVAARTPGGETIARNDTLLPMMSIFKFPVALAVLDRMQREGIPLTQPISIRLTCSYPAHTARCAIRCPQAAAR